MSFIFRLTITGLALFFALFLHLVLLPSVNTNRNTNSYGPKDKQQHTHTDRDTSTTHEHTSPRTTPKHTPYTDRYLGLSGLLSFECLFFGTFSLGFFFLFTLLLFQLHLRQHSHTSSNHQQHSGVSTAPVT